MLGKIFKMLMLLVLAVVIWSVASIAGVRNDDKKAKLAAEESDAAETVIPTPNEVTSPYQQYTGGGVLDLQMDYEVQVIGDDVLVSVVSNLPNSFDLTAELSNVNDVKRQLGFENISSSALTQEQMNSINELTYSRVEKNFVTNGVTSFTFKNPPMGQLDLKITSPITKLQPPSVQELLGQQGVNLQGSYVVFLEEVEDKQINFTGSFVIGEQGDGSEEATKE